MKFTKQDLLTMLIGLFLFSSCKDNNTIGLPPDGSTITGDLYENTTLTSRTLEDQAVMGTNLNRYPIGLMNDAVFGKTEAGTAMTVNIPSVGYRFGDNAVVDSAVLILPYATNFYGDSTQNFTFTVKQMAVDLSLQSSFLTSVDWGSKTMADAQGGFLGENKDKQQRPTTPFKVTNIVTGKPDTAATVAPQLRIRLDAQKIQNRIVRMDTNAYARNELFVRNFNGLYVSVTNATGSGAMSFFNLGTASDANGGAKLQIYYKKTGTVALTMDTVSVSFPINYTTSPVAAAVKHDYSTAAAVKAQLDAPANATQFSKTYVQGLTGLKNKISFDFTEFKALLAGSKVSINKAELVVDVDPEGDTYFKPAQRLRLVRFNAAGLLVNLPDNDRTIANAYNGDVRALRDPILFGGYFDSVNRRYIFSVTAYIQDLVDGKTQDYGTFISPASNTEAEFTVSPFATIAERSVLLGPIKDAPAGTKRMKLNIFYTKLK